MRREKNKTPEFITVLGGAGWPLAAYRLTQLRRGTSGSLQPDDGQVNRSQSRRPDRAKVLTQSSRV
jgi:hypothetical protein